jgi:hypothetical protein
MDHWRYTDRQERGKVQDFAPDGSGFGLGGPSERVELGPRVMVGEPCYQSGQILGEICEKAGSQSGQDRIFF